MKRFLILIVVVFFCNCSEKKKKEVIVTPEKKISQINFFMETSGSMAGYLKGETAFRNNIPNLLVEIGGKIDSGHTPLRTYFVADSVTPFNGSTQEYINTIAVKSPANGKSSQMHKIFQMIADRTDSNDISLFVSDCILSYADDVIKQNQEINRVNAAGELKSTMTDAFLRLRKKNDMCASLYGFNSAFWGNYYTYQNTKLPLQGTINRPYYIWVMGNKDLLLKFNKQLKELQGFKPDHIAIDFGIFSAPVQDYTILFMLGKKGEWSTNYKELEEVKASAKEKAAFSMAVDLSALPAYASDTAYLLKNLVISAGGLTTAISRVFLTSGINRTQLKEKEKDIVNNNTHIIEVEINDIYKSGNIDITLPLQYDTAYRKQSIMDDRIVGDIAGKTFAFEHLVDGVRNAYQTNNQHFIQISIPVKK